jgi:hypothetical protein
MKRFFYSGCSYTEYGYPTWADIIAYDLITRGEIDFAYNLGKGGACNEYIANQLIMAKHQAKITSDDIMGVGWTTPWRHSVLNNYHAGRNQDEYDQKAVWQTFGNVATNHFWDVIPDHLEKINTDAYLLQRTCHQFNVLNDVFDFAYQSRMLTNECIEIQQEEDFVDNLNLMSMDHTAYLKGSFKNYVDLPTLDDESKYRDKNGILSESETNFRNLYQGHPTMTSHLKMAQKITDLHDDTVAEISRLEAILFDMVDTNIARLPNKSHDEIRHEVFEILDLEWEPWRQMPGWNCISTYSAYDTHRRSFFNP